MGRCYTPTLGGLVVGCKFLADVGISLPVIQLNFYDDKRETEKLLLKRALDVYGPHREAVDVRLTNERSNLFIGFLHNERHGPEGYDRALRQRLGVIIESGPAGSDFEDFIGSLYGRMFVNICISGKSEPSWLDLLALRFFPNRYAEKYFSDMTEPRLSES